MTNGVERCNILKNGTRLLVNSSCFDREMGECITGKIYEHLSGEKLLRYLIAGVICSSLGKMMFYLSMLNRNMM